MFKPLILVVDDEKDFADHLRETIEGSGKYDVKTAYSARDAFIELERGKRMLDIPKNRVACIILDISMPGMNGMEFLEKLWKVRRAEYDKSPLEFDQIKTYIPVIILSAWEDTEKWEKTPGKVEYLRKPLNEEELFTALDKVIRGGEAEWEKMRIEARNKGRQRGFLK